MKWRRSDVVAATTALTIVIALVFLRLERRDRAAETAAREARYAIVVDDYSHRFLPGSTRKQIEDSLRQEGMDFFHSCCMGASHNASDTLVKIGEESPPWYCSEHYVYVGFEFVRDHKAGDAEARESDPLTSVRLYKQLTGCL
jgi:hypothetical protein